MKFLYIILLSLLAACAPILPETNNQFRITEFHQEKLTNHRSKDTILISQTQASQEYQTEQMHYISKPYQLSSFAKNSWVSPPAGMLTPLIVQSMQQSNYFFAVASGPDADKTDYRLDTQLISLQQNFLTHPSTLELSIQVMLTYVEENRIVSSRTFTFITPCPKNNPYGGVIAANKATEKLTSDLTKYVIHEIERDLRHIKSNTTQSISN